MVFGHGKVFSRFSNRAPTIAQKRVSPLPKLSHGAKRGLKLSPNLSYAHSLQQRMQRWMKITTIETGWQ
jgi:hypothetical protein